MRRFLVPAGHRERARRPALATEDPAVSIAFVAYESPYAPCGGIAAVMGRLPAQLQSQSGRETIVITPYHQHVEKTTSLPMTEVGSFGVSYGDRSTLVRVMRFEGPVPYYFLRPDDTSFFAGRRHPYDMDAGQLVRDALFFGSAATRALHLIQPGQRWQLLLQDWECATVALALADQPGRHRCFLTLHNSYDCPISIDQLRQAKMQADYSAAGTILHRALGVVEWPVLTVSQQFANDLKEDVLQTQILASHMQYELRERVRGIDNGPFADCAIPESILSAATAGQFEPFKNWKAEYRHKFVQAVSTAAHNMSGERHLWGNLPSPHDEDRPWFVMAGRDDPRQKGYDIAATAAAQVLEAGVNAKFLFFPIPGDEGIAGLQFLRRLAEKYPASVLVLPFLFKEGFHAALRGAAFGMMPSLYEPFGMANEFYLNGTMGIGRATGGITQQIIPLRAAACCSPAVEWRAGRWHTGSTLPTGLLFHERDGLPSEIEDWSGINQGRYAMGEQAPDRPQERDRYPLYRSMCDELRLAILDAIQLYTADPLLYWQMLTGGVWHVRRSFSWARTAQQYLRVLD